MKRAAVVSSLALVLLATVACEQPNKEPVVLPGPPEQLVPDHWTPLEVRDAGQGTVGPVAVGRQSRRLTVTQLEASLKEVSGSEWTVDVALPSVLDGGRPAVVPVSILPFVGPSMGRADFINEFRNDDSINPMFTKLYDNWASDVCGALVLKDLDPANATKRLMVRPVAWDGGVPASARRAAVLENVRLARLHFHSVFTPPERAEAELGHLADTFEAVSGRFRAEHVSDGGPRAFTDEVSDAYAWVAVCTLLTTDPEFVTY